MHRFQDEDEGPVLQSRAPIASERKSEGKAPVASPSWTCRRCRRSRGRCCCSRAAPCAAASSAPGARTRASGWKATRRRTDSQSDRRCACLVDSAHASCGAGCSTLCSVRTATSLFPYFRFTAGEPLGVLRRAVGSRRPLFQVKKQTAPTAPAPARPAAARGWAPPAPPTPDA